MPTIRASTKADVDRVLALTRQAFNIPAASQQRRREKMKLDQIHVVEADGEVQATARAIPFGHFFGGRAVRAVGISAVAVAAEARGKGLGRELMTEVLTQQRDAGVPISSLYPATVPIYRSLGYGYGGIRTDWQVKLDLLRDTPGPAVAPFDGDAIDELDTAYRRFASQTNGLVERSAEWWSDLLGLDEDDPKYRYLVREDGVVTGWVVYSLEKSKDDWRSTVTCRDLYAMTPGAANAILSLGALHRSTSVAMRWNGPVSEPLGDLTREDIIASDGSFRYMVRLLDVPAAFEARGYPAGLEVEVTLAVEDPMFPANAGPWRVQVSGGRAKVAPADRADAGADVQTWASLWTGLRDPSSAARIGAIRADERSLDALRLMFAGPTPWIADFY